MKASLMHTTLKMAHRVLELEEALIVAIPHVQLSDWIRNTGATPEK